MAETCHHPPTGEPVDVFVSNADGVAIHEEGGVSCFNLGVEQMANASLSRNFTH